MYNHYYKPFYYNHHSLIYIQCTHPSPSLTCVCPSSTRSQAPLPRSQTRIVLSLDPEARRPPGSTAREDTYYNIEQGREILIIISISIIIIMIIIISIIIIIILLIIITCNI